MGGTTDTYKKPRTLQQRLLLAINGAIVVVLAVLIFLQSWDTSRFARDEAAARAEETAFRYANQVSAELNAAMVAARTLAQTFEGMKAAWVEDRSLLNSTLSQVQRQNPRFLATWSVWEPGAMDNKDATFVNQAGHDSTGRFIPLWRHEKDDVALEPLVGYASPGAGDYCLVAKTTGKQSIAEPFHTTIGGRDTMLTSVAVPVKYNGDVVGVAGVHIALATLQGIVAGIKPYDTGYAILISRAGTIVAHPDASQVGRRFADAAVLSQLAESKGSGAALRRQTTSTVTGDEVLEIYAPIDAGGSGSRWFLAVAAPMDKVLAGAAAVRTRSIGLGVLAAIVMLVLVIWVSRSIAGGLVDITQTLTDSARQVQGASGQLRSASRELAQGATSQAASLEELSASMEEIGARTAQNAGSAQETKSIAQEARQAAERGAKDVDALNEALGAITASSQSITKTVKIIDEIAFQTNILALNAAVEAARAGDAGLGFAVVAEEVRNLARRSAEAAKETAQRIGDSAEKSRHGVSVGTKVADRLREITVKVSRVDDLVGGIVSGSEEQRVQVAEMNRALEHVGRITQSNAAAAEESSAASETMGGQADSLESSVDQLNQLVGENSRMAGLDWAAEGVQRLRGRRSAGPGVDTEQDRAA